MMDWTDRHCRMFHRQLTRHALLYTEMVTAMAIARFRARAEGDAWHAYLRLREINPAPFAAYLDLPDGRIVCSSPERFLRVRGRPLSDAAAEVLKHVGFLWGFPVRLEFLGPAEAVLETRQCA